MEQNSTKKSRYWAFIYYEESPIKDYKQWFMEHGSIAIISPWHDKDINETTGEIKKKHKHIILVYEGPTTYNQVKQITNEFNSPIPIPQINIKGAVRYLTHANNPEKFQYDKNDIELIGLSSLQEVIDLTKEDIEKIWQDIYKVMKEKKIYEYSDLVDYYLKSGLITEFDYVISHTLAINTYIISKRNKKELRKKAKLEKEKEQILNSITKELTIKNE